MLKIIHAQPSPDPLKDPDTRVCARIPGWKNSMRVIITTRGPISPSICSLFQSPYLVGYVPFKLNLIWICFMFLWIYLKCKTRLFPLAKMPVCHLKKECSGCIHKQWVCYPKPNHKSSLIPGASCKHQCHCIMLVWWSDLWPHIWCCCQTGSIWRYVHRLAHTHQNMQSKHRSDFTRWSRDSKA